MPEQAQVPILIGMKKEVRKVGRYALNHFYNSLVGHWLLLLDAIKECCQIFA